LSEIKISGLTSTGRSTKAARGIRSTKRGVAESEAVHNRLIQRGKELVAKELVVWGLEAEVAKLQRRRP